MYESWEFVNWPTNFFANIINVIWKRQSIITPKKLVSFLCGRVWPRMRISGAVLTFLLGYNEYEDWETLRESLLAHK